MRGTGWIWPAVFLAATAGTAIAADDGTSAPSGAAVYQEHCAKCHSGGFGGFFTGAPKTGDEDDWEKLTPKGLDALTATTLAGIGKMPARGECESCTDADIRAAVEYMLEKSR